MRSDPTREAVQGWPPTDSTDIRTAVSHSPSPWITAKQAATRARVGVKVIYRAVESDHRPDGRRLMEWHLQALLRAKLPASGGRTVSLAEKPIDAVTTADIEAIRDGWELRTTRSFGGRVGADRALKRLRHFYNWSIERRYVDRTPFKRHGVSVVHFMKEQPRTRRLEPGEEERLLKHAPPHLGALIVAALETGCRLGELLGLRWRDVKWKQNVLLLPTEITKTAEARDVPMSQRFKAVLRMRQHAPDGSEQPTHAFVFGNEDGGQVRSIREVWTKTCDVGRVSSLHFHDLRREAASRLRESGAPDHVVAAWLGHAAILTISRYLRANRVGLQRYLRRFEEHRKACTEFAQSPTDDASAVVTPSASDFVKLLEQLR